MTAADLEEVRDWLAAEALIQDRPVVLFRLVCERLLELRLVRPGLSVIEQSLVGAAREAAPKETAARVAHPGHPRAVPVARRAHGGFCAYLGRTPKSPAPPWRPPQERQHAPGSAPVVLAEKGNL